MSDSNEAEQVVRPFADFYAEIRRGAAHSEASEALHDLIAAVQDTRKAGRLTITIDVSISKGTDMVSVVDSVTTKTPRLERPVSLWWTDDSGNLTRRDPRQTQLEFEGIRAVPNTENRKNA